MIAGRLPGRTANDVKNFWHTHLWRKVVREKEEEKEKKKPKETMKAHEVIKPRPITFSTNSPWLNRKHNNFVTEPILASNQISKDCVSAPQTSLGNAPIPCAMWSDFKEQLGSEKIGSSSSLLQEENFNMEFPIFDDSFWNSNLCGFDSLCDL